MLMKTENIVLRYQWIKGDLSGKIEIFKETKEENGEQWTYFVSGKRIRSSLVSEFMLKLNEGEVPLQIELPPTITNVYFENNNPTPTHQIQQEPKIVKSPIRDLLEKQCKEQKKITVNVEISVPTKELYQIIRDAYGEEANDELKALLFAKISADKVTADLNDAIINMIKHYYIT